MRFTNDCHTRPQFIFRHILGSFLPAKIESPPHLWAHFKDKISKRKTQRHLFLTVNWWRLKTNRLYAVLFRGRRKYDSPNAYVGGKDWVAGLWQQSLYRKLMLTIKESLLICAAYLRQAIFRRTSSSKLKTCSVLRCDAAQWRTYFLRSSRHYIKS